MSVTMKLLYDQRKMLKKNSAYAFKLRVTFDRKTLEYQTIYALSKEDHSKLKASRLGEALRQVREGLSALTAAAQTFGDHMGSFSFYEFERDFVGVHPGFKKRKLAEQSPAPETTDFDFTPYVKRFKTVFQEVHPSKQHISYTYLHYIKKLIQQQRMGSALNYLNSYSSLKKFKGNLRFSDITDTHLVQYEKWMLAKGRSLTTVAINLIPLRCIFNEAAEELGIINKKHCYPFGRRKYQIPSTRNTKKAFDSSELNLIYNFKTSDQEILLAMDYWWFLYFGNGMNLKDAALLKYGIIEGEFIIFRRSKIDRTARHQTLPISVYINEDIQAIIGRRGNQAQQKDNYIFPILRTGLNALEQHDVIKGFINFINSNMRKVCKEIGLDKQSTTKVTRHSFATQQKQNGSSREEIREALGHQLPSTTDFYMDSFELKVKKTFAQNTVKFKNAAPSNQQS